MPRRVRAAGMMQLTAALTLAVGLFVLGIFEAVLGFRDGGVGMPLSGPLAAEVLVVAGLTLPLAWRRRRALWALGGVGGGGGAPRGVLVPPPPRAGAPRAPAV